MDCLGAFVGTLARTRVNAPARSGKEGEAMQTKRILGAPADAVRHRPEAHPAVRRLRISDLLVFPCPAHR